MLEGFKVGLGLIFGGATGVLVLYVLWVLLPGSGTGKGKMKGRGWR